MSEKKLVLILKGFIYAVAVVPLIIFSQYISPFHFGKVVVFRSLVELAAVVFILLLWQNRSYLPKPSIVFWGILAFAFAFAVSTLASFQIYESFWGTLERMGGLWTFLHYVIYFVILTSIIRSEKDWFNLLKFVVFVGVLSAFYGFLQKTDWELIVGSGDRTRIFGTLGNAALFAGYQILIMFLAATLYLRSQNTERQRFFFASAVIINLIAILMTAVRGSILAVGVGLVTFAFLYAWTFNSAKAKKALVTLLVLAGVFVLFAQTMKDSSFVQNSGYLRRLTDFSLKTFTVQTRFWAWEAGIEGWKETPKTILLGWGPENFNLPFSKHFNPKFYTSSGAETLFDRAHNMFVEALVTMGLVGFLAYITMLGSVLWVLRQVLKNGSQVQKVTAIGLTSMMLAYMIHNFFIFDTSANFVAFFTIAGFISFLYKPQEAIVFGPNLSKNTLFKLVAVILSVVALGLIYKTNIIPAKANYATTRGIVAGWTNDFNRSSEKFRQSIEYDVPGKYEVRHRYAQYIFEYSAKQQTVSPELKKEIEYVIEKVKELAQDRPLDYLPRLYISRMYIVLGRADAASPYNDEALKYSLEALNISPTFIRTYYEVAQAYLNKKDYANAMDYFQRAANLNPDNGLSYWYWGMTKIQAGDIEGGLHLVETARSKGYGPDESDLLRLINVYVKLNDFQKLVEVHEKLIEIAPDTAQYHASLAVAYARVGRIDDAVVQAKEAARLDPKFAPDAKAFVESLGRQW